MSSDSLKIKFFKKLLEVAQYVLQDKRDPEETGERLQEIIDEKDAAKFESDTLRLQSDTESRKADILNRIRTATARGLIKWEPTTWDCGNIPTMSFRMESKNGIYYGADAFWEQKENSESKEYIVWRIRVISNRRSDLITLSDDDSKFFTAVIKMVYAEKLDGEMRVVQSGFSSLPLV